jgi:hypothetical protein
MITESLSIDSIVSQDNFIQKLIKANAMLLNQASKLPSKEDLLLQKDQAL